MHSIIRRQYSGMIATAALCALLAASTPAGAQSSGMSSNFSRQEIALLPDYCRDKIGDTFDKNAEYWRTRIGPMWLHIHHYCYGLAAWNRATLMPKLSAQARQFAVSRSVTEFNYVLRAKPPRDWVLLPELLSNQGRSLMRLKRYEDAVPMLQAAIEIKPDYWPPYIVMSDFFQGAGDTAKALEWIDKGLAAAPNVKALATRRAEIEAARRGGKAPQASRTEEGSRPAPRAEPPAPREAADAGDAAK